MRFQKLASDIPEPKISVESILRAKESGRAYNSGRRGTATVEFYVQGAL